MMRSRPGIPSPAGNDADADYQRNQHRRSGSELRPKNSTNVKWQQTTQGYVARVEIPRASPEETEPTGGMVFRGLWHNAVAYQSQNVVFRTASGGSAGVYIALLDNIPTGTAPETGAPYWAAFPYPPPGVWG